MSTSSTPSTSSSSSFLFAACQLAVGKDKKENQASAKAAIEQAVAKKAQIVALPECWNSVYANSAFPEYAEKVPDGESCQLLAQLAKKHQIYLIGGSVPERDGEALYNTCVVYSPKGELLVKHRKVHLFDIDIPGKIRFIESDTLAAGDQLSFFDTEYGRIGIGICYDIRFAKYAQVLAEDPINCKFLVYPGAFNTTTGPAHWELLLRARALDNQLYTAAVSPARNMSGKGYQAWGHSSVVSPWGDVVATTEHHPDILYAQIDFSRVEEVRSQIPVRKQQRPDVYNKGK
eukprot:CAMPEP_0201556206 /NCGR_PEP_ID=MMETSP0173_2-20130828/53879_1 /ASSEMBLY_ACC=CAM_ASM_000268 /TAXON_ID=218659 /ORGANISM="Vexillifera sp., Strain DIVA3 564/2" /LENGTH=288 /DNA_ID=CAMNT_0047968355 /DNA_START=66 /DNA_END=932 /DNA_ORIENTATION=-